LHHVFEHFTRPVALALLCRWRNWLKPGGLLRIETPDAMACFIIMTSQFVSFDDKQQVMRHLYGSHEAAWAVHYDGWYKDKFEITLSKLGFGDLKFIENEWGMTKNIEVYADKLSYDLDANQYAALIKQLFIPSTIRLNQKEIDMPVGSELDMLNVWMNMWRAAYSVK